MSDQIMSNDSLNFSNVLESFITRLTNIEQKLDHLQKQQAISVPKGSEIDGALFDLPGTFITKCFDGNSMTDEDTYVITSRVGPFFDTLYLDWTLPILKDFLNDDEYTRLLDKLGQNCTSNLTCADMKWEDHGFRSGYPLDCAMIHLATQNIKDAKGEQVWRFLTGHPNCIRISAQRDGNETHDKFILICEHLSILKKISSSDNTASSWERLNIYRSSSDIMDILSPDIMDIFVDDYIFDDDPNVIKERFAELSYHERVSLKERVDNSFRRQMKSDNDDDVYNFVTRDIAKNLKI